MHEHVVNVTATMGKILGRNDSGPSKSTLLSTALDLTFAILWIVGHGMLVYCHVRHVEESV